MNILDFIDSPDIRKCCKDHAFTPSEQAVLCMQSNIRSYDEKMQFLAELIVTNDFETVTYREPDFNKSETVNIGSLVRERFKNWQTSRPDPNKKEDGIVYLPVARTLGQNDPMLIGVFDTFGAAIDSLDVIEQKGNCLSISRETINAPEYVVTYTFGKSGQILKASLSVAGAETNVDLQYSFCVNVPHPFRTGDILVAEEERVQPETPGFAKKFFCVFDGFKPLSDGYVTYAGNEDMRAQVGVYNEQNMDFIWYANPSILCLRKCGEGELPASQKPILEMAEELKKAELSVRMTEDLVTDPDALPFH